MHKNVAVNSHFLDCVRRIEWTEGVSVIVFPYIVFRSVRHLSSSRSNVKTASSLRRGGILKTKVSLGWGGFLGLGSVDLLENRFLHVLTRWGSRLLLVSVKKLLDVRCLLNLVSARVIDLKMITNSAMMLHCLVIGCLAKSMSDQILCLGMRATFGGSNRCLNLLNACASPWSWSCRRALSIAALWVASWWGSFKWTFLPLLLLHVTAAILMMKISTSHYISISLQLLLIVTLMLSRYHWASIFAVRLWLATSHHLIRLWSIELRVEILLHVTFTTALIRSSILVRCRNIKFLCTTYNTNRSSVVVTARSVTTDLFCHAVRVVAVEVECRLLLGRLLSGLFINANRVECYLFYGDFFVMVITSRHFCI